MVVNIFVMTSNKIYIHKRLCMGQSIFLKAKILTLMQKKRFWPIIGHYDPNIKDIGNHNDMNDTRNEDMLCYSETLSFQVIQTKYILPLTPTQEKLFE